MFLFADGDGSFGFLLFIIVMVMGTRQICKFLKGSEAARGVAKKGALSLLSHLFKK